MLLQARCIHCNSQIDFEPEQLNQRSECPSCNQSTPLWLPKSERAIKNQSDVATRNFFIVLGVSLFTGAIVAVIAGITSSQILGVISAMLLVVGGICLYFVPAVVGRKKKNATAILLLNIFAGWTFAGWIIALVWSATKEDKP